MIRQDILPNSVRDWKLSMAFAGHIGRPRINRSPDRSQRTMVQVTRGAVKRDDLIADQQWTFPAKRPRSFLVSIAFSCPLLKSLFRLSVTMDPEYYCLSNPLPRHYPTL